MDRSLDRPVCLPGVVAGRMATCEVVTDESTWTPTLRLRERACTCSERLSLNAHPLCNVEEQVAERHFARAV